MKKEIILYGAGGHAKVVKECLEAQGNKLFGFVDDQPQVKLSELPHLGTYSSHLNEQAEFVIAIGNNEHRRKICTRISHRFTNAIHPSALISESVQLGSGCMIFHRAIVQASTKIGNHVILNTAAQVDHDCIIGDFVHVGPGAVLCGDITIGEGVFIGAGAIVLPGIKIGKWVTVGAGSIVTKDFPDHVLVYGNPAISRRSN